MLECTIRSDSLETFNTNYNAVYTWVYPKVSGLSR